MSDRSTGTQKRESPAETTAAITLTFANQGATPFVRGNWGWVLEAGFGGLDSTPGPVLDANGGVQSVAAARIPTGIHTGPNYIWAAWVHPETQRRFGVQIYLPFQMSSSGKPPYWYVSLDTLGTIDQEPDWEVSGDDPADPYTWPPDAGFTIVATPTAAHTSLDVNVLVQDPLTSPWPA